MHLLGDLHLGLRVCVYLASHPREGGTTAVEIAQALGTTVSIAWGMLRRLRNRGVIVVDCSCSPVRAILTRTPEEMDLRKVADAVWCYRPSPEDWRDTSKDVILEAATIAVEKGRNAWGRRGVGTLADLVKVLDANRGGKRKARR